MLVYVYACVYMCLLMCVTMSKCMFVCLCVLYDCVYICVMCVRFYFRECVYCCEVSDKEESSKSLRHFSPL